MADAHGLNLTAAVAGAGSVLLRLLPAETAHDLGLQLLQKPLFKPLWPGPCQSFDQSVGGADLSCELAGLGRLTHPVGLAAGFDKNAVAVEGLRDLGFAFLELGTVTPLPQSGNPKPRLFRQTDQRALINRMGFNNEGCARVAQRLRGLSGLDSSCLVGINIGKNKATSLEAALADYIAAAAAFAGLASYLVINISSPNTPGLRALASKDFITALAKGLASVWKGCGQEKVGLKGVWIKLDPDMAKPVFQELVATIAREGFSGLILSNTHRIDWPEAGGQSGHPLALLSTACLEWAYEVHQGSLAMVASGGILAGSDIFQKVIRGASAVQIYTALIYRGPWVVVKLLKELQQELKLRQIVSLSSVQGQYYRDTKLAQR